MIRRGETWWASLPEPAGSEPGFRRPLLIVSADSYNASRIGTVVAIVITSNLRLADAPGNVRLPLRGAGLSKPSVANVSRVVTVDKSFLTERVGRLAPRLLAEIEAGLRLVLSI